MDNLFSEQQRDGHNQHRADCDGNEAVTSRFSDFSVVFKTDVIADDWSGCNGNAHVKGNEEVVDVHDNRHRRDAVLAKVPHDDEIKKQRRDSGGHFCQHFAASVRAGFHENRPVDLRFAKANVAVFPEIVKTNQHADGN